MCNYKGPISLNIGLSYIPTSSSEGLLCVASYARSFAISSILEYVVFGTKCCVTEVAQCLEVWVVIESVLAHDPDGLPHKDECISSLGAMDK